MPTNKEILLTEEGRADLDKELRNLIDIERPDVIEQLQNARANGDLSENADYDAARNRQASIEGRIKEIENIIAVAKTVKEEKKAKVINISNTVEFERLDTNKIEKVKIVSSIESNPLVDDPNQIVKISNVCALGTALVGSKVGDEVTVKVLKPYNIKIISFK
ncbi:MAG TPA: transcription elongation factor GreA [Candidatus Onthovivens sp.]|nr:transcription elongation factor GreA [Candidatus Onthovivens sp.]